MFKFRLVPFFCMLLPLVSIAQSSGDCFPLWQGFSQRWGYNHRIHRLGDWVVADGVPGECKGELGHAAATGSGADSAAFTQYYAWVRSDLVDFQQGTTTFQLTGKEGESIVLVEDAAVALPDVADPYAQFEVLLNGFDLCTADGAKADKIQSLDLGIDSVWVDPAAGKVRFRMRVGMRFSCASAECEALNQVVDYRLQVWWLAVGGPGFVSTRSSYGSARDWEKTDTADLPPIAKVALLGDARYPAATVGIRGLHIQLDREQHMLGWESRVQCFGYVDGLLTLGVRMHFQQHDPDMYGAFKRHYAGGVRPPARWVVKRKAGKMVWEMDVALLQFESAQVEYGLRKGGIRWETKHGAQVPASSGEAVNLFQVRSEK
jgi:hypothetical protein